MKDSDKELWAKYTRQVCPSKRKKTTHTKKATEPSLAKSLAQACLQLMLGPSKPLEVPHRLERSREKALRKGEMEIDAKLDMHGMTQNKAFDALARFMRKSIKNGARCLLIITGKGNKGEGILRRNLKEWISQLPEADHVLAIRQAAICHGGDGAFYILLRKNKKLT